MNNNAFPLSVFFEEVVPQQPFTLHFKPNEYIECRALPVVSGGKPEQLASEEE